MTENILPFKESGEKVQLSNLMATAISLKKKENDPDAIIIKEKEVERVETFKHLGIVLDNKLRWKNNTDVIVSKIKTRM